MGDSSCYDTEASVTFQTMPASQSPSAGERDKKISDIATKAAAAFAVKHENVDDQEIARAPEAYLGFTIPYLIVRALHRLEKDSRKFAIINGCLAAALVILTFFLAIYASRLDALTHSLIDSERSTQLSSPTPQQSGPTSTTAPVLKAIPVATPELTPSPSPRPTPAPHRRQQRRHR